MPEIFNAATHLKKKLSQTRKVLENLKPVDAVNYYSEVMRKENPSKNPFQAYAAKPLSVHSFDSQTQDEQVLLLLRKHPITQLGKITTLVLLVLLPFFFPSVDFYLNLPGNFKLATIIFWYLLCMGYLLETFLTWFYNIYIVTNERIIDVDFLSLIYKNVSAAKIDNIEDISATTGGALQSLFDFGEVRIQTAAERTEFEFEDVPHPTKVTQFINEMILEEEREKIEGRVS
jgi:hypothetical protein